MAAHPNLIRVPRHLAPVTSIDAAQECDPQAVGMHPRAVQRIWGAVEAMYRTGLHPGIQLTIRRHGRLLMNRAIGHARGNGPDEDCAPARLLRTDTPVCLFSASKAVTAMLAHKMAELGKLSLDDCVADHLPAYAAQGKGATTLRQLLAHRAGIPALPLRNVDPALLTDWDLVIRLLCAARPVHSHGQQQSYHAVTAGYIVGEVVRRVSGQPLDEVLRSVLAEPLGCRYLRYGLAPEDRAMAALNYTTGAALTPPLRYVAKRALGLPFTDLAPLSNEDHFLSAIIPAANIFATADETCRFYEMLLRHGMYGGRRLFEAQTVRTAIAPVGSIQFDRTLFVPIRFSSGFILGEWPFGLYGGNCHDAFGHLGFINIVTWADPRRDISVALLTTGKSMTGAGLKTLGRVLWAVGHYCKPLR